jgi:hypothetical protein
VTSFLECTKAQYLAQLTWCFLLPVFYFLSCTKLCNKAKDKAVCLDNFFLDNFELLNFEIRLCVDMKILAIKKQAELSELMESIGKQFIGWRNTNW